MTDWSEIEGLGRRNQDNQEPLAEWKTRFLEARPLSAKLLLFWDKMVVQDLSLVAKAAWGNEFVLSRVNENWQVLVDLFNIDSFVAGQSNQQEVGFRWAVFGPDAYFDVLVHFKDFSPTNITVHGKTTLTTSKTNENELKKVLALVFEAGPCKI
jgi:hypothetical protein